MNTIREFCNKSNIDHGLIRAVIRQCHGFSSFKEIAPHVVAHGADAGFGKFIYYTDTVAFYGRNRAAINRMAADIASDIGEGGAIDLIASFDCIKGDFTVEEIAATMYGDKSRMDTQIANALAWFALEEVSISLDSHPHPEA